jgi:hypothetical protein
LMRGGTYEITNTQGVKITHSGTWDNPYTIKNYASETPILSASTITMASAYGVLGIGYGSTNYHNITIYGINISHVNGPAIDEAAYGIIIWKSSYTSASSDIKIQFCSFFDMSHYAVYFPSSGYLTGGYRRNVEVTNCSFNHIQTTWSTGEGVSFCGVYNFT